jgi:hypothetical protein
MPFSSLIASPTETGFVRQEMKSREKVGERVLERQRDRQTSDAERSEDGGDGDAQVAQHDEASDHDHDRANDGLGETRQGEGKTLVAGEPRDADDQETCTGQGGCGDHEGLEEKLQPSGRPGGQACRFEARPRSHHETPEQGRHPRIPGQRAQARRARSASQAPQEDYAESQGYADHADREGDRRDQRGRERNRLPARHAHGQEGRESLPLSPTRQTVQSRPAHAMFVTQLPVAVPPELLGARTGLPEEEKDHQAYGQRQEITDRLKHVGPLPRDEWHSPCQGFMGRLPRKGAR